MFAFTDGLIKAGLEGDPAAEKLLGEATGRNFVRCHAHASRPEAFYGFRGELEALEAPTIDQSLERLGRDVQRGMSAIHNHAWILTSGPDAIVVCGFVYDVDTDKPWCHVRLDK